MVDRAEQCAAFIDFCDVAELKMLADGKEWYIVMLCSRLLPHLHFILPLLFTFLSVHNDDSSLLSELEEFQAVTQPQDKAKKVCNILRKQSELKRMMENFAMDVEPNTNDVFDDYMYYHW